MAFILLYGRPGSGKTKLACSMTNLGYKVNIIDIDQKANNMQILKKEIDEGKIIVQTIDEKLSEVSLRTKILTPQVALVKQPKGWLRICDIITSYEDEITSGKTRQDEVLVFDSLTSGIEHMKRLISNIQKKDKFSFDEWNIVLTNLEEFFMTMMRLQKLFKHVIIIAHEQTEVNEDGRVINILPAIEGSMRNKVSKYFEEVYHLRVEVKVGKAEYQVCTKPLDKAEARTSRLLEAIEKSDFSVLFKEEAK